MPHAQGGYGVGYGLASTSGPGLAPTLPGDAAKFYAGDGNYLYPTPPGVYNVLNYELVGDGLDLVDGAISIGSTTLSSLSAGFTPSDTGKVFGVKGAGVSGGWLIATGTYVSPTQITLSVAASATVSAKEWFYFTDDSDAFHNLIVLVFVYGGGEILFPLLSGNRFYGFNRALQNGITGQASVALDFNSQFYIPNLPGDTGDYYVNARTNGNVRWGRVSITFSGVCAPSQGQYYSLNSSSNINTPHTGVRLRSTIQGSGIRPAFFGGKGGVHGTDNNYNFNPAQVLWRNISIEVTEGSGHFATMGGLNLRDYKNAHVKHCVTTPHTMDLFGSSEPTGDTAGFWMPRAFCEPVNTIESCIAVGMKSGFVLGEHTSFKDIHAITCVDCIKTTKSRFYINYGAHFYADNCKYVVTADASTSTTSENDYPVSVSGTAETQVNFIAGVVEPYYTTGKWFTPAALVNDIDSFLTGSIELTFDGNDPSFGAGVVSAAAKIGGKNLRLKNHGVFSPQISTHTGTTYTFTYLYEAYQLHEFSNAAAVTLTIPNETTTTVNYDIGQEIVCTQTGTGQVTPTAAAGVTLQFPTGKTKSAGQYSQFVLTKRSANTWSVRGDLA